MTVSDHRRLGTWNLVIVSLFLARDFKIPGQSSCSRSSAGVSFVLVSLDVPVLAEERLYRSPVCVGDTCTCIVLYLDVF